MKFLSVVAVFLVVVVVVAVVVVVVAFVVVVVADVGETMTCDAEGCLLDEKLKKLIYIKLQTLI